MPRSVISIAGSRLLLAAQAMFILAEAQPLQAAEPVPKYEFKSLIDSTSGITPTVSRTKVNRSGQVAFIGLSQLTKVDFPTQRTVRGAYVFGPFGLTAILEVAGDGDGPGYVNINDAGKIVVEGSNQLAVTNPEFQQLYAANVVGDLRFVAGTNGPYERFDNFGLFSGALIDSRGRVVFNAALDTGGGGIFNGPDPVANKIADNAGPPRGPLLQGVRADNTVLFRADTPEGGKAIYGATNAATSLVLDYGKNFINPFEYVENKQGGVAFVAGRRLADGTTQYGIFTGSDPKADAYVISGESLYHAAFPAISDDGLVLFDASLDADGKMPGIFRGPDPVADKIIDFGDELFGSTVVNVRLAGIDGFNRAFFDYVLADGRIGIASVLVPEPASIGLLLPAALVLLRRRKPAST